MKRNEKLLDAIGQIDDKLVEEAANAGRRVGGRKKTGVKLQRWQSALAACAALAVCVGVIGLLSRSGMLLGPLSSGSSGAEEAAIDASAQDAAAQSALAQDAAEGLAGSSARSAEAVAEAAESAPEAASQYSAFDGAAAGNEQGNAQEAGDRTQSAVAGDLAAAEEDGGISAQSADQEEAQDGQKKEGADAGAAELTVKAGDGRSVTFLVKNGGTQEIHFGEAFELERFVNEGWEKVVPEKETVWNEVDILVGAGDTYEETIVLDSYYGTLQPGQYRILKTYLTASGEEPEGQETYLMYGEFAVGE